MSAPAVVFDLSNTGCAVARCLGRRGVPVTGVHRVPYPATGARSRYVERALLLQADAGDDDALAAFDAIAARGGERPVVLCTTDAAVDFVSRRRAQLEQRFRLPGATPLPLHVLLDKGVQADVAARAGLRVPPTVVLRRGTARIARALAAIPLPAIVKPGNSLFGYKRLIGVENTREDLVERVTATLPECPYVVVSAYVPGAASANFTVMLLGRDDGGAIVAAVTRKLRQLPRLAFGTGTLVETCEDDELAELARAFVREAGVTGPVEIELKREDGTGRPWFLEANLRSSALVEMTAAAGSNLPYLAYLAALGEPLPKAAAPAQHVVWVDELRDWRTCANGEVTLEELLRAYDGVTLRSLHAEDDPAPFEAARRDALAAAGEDRALLALALDRLNAPAVTA